MKRSDSTKTLVKNLKRQFRLHFDSAPDWAWPYVPSMPFVGDDYEPGKSILIYASAENLNWLNRREEIPPRFTSNRAWDRYRAAYEAKGRKADSFFPDVGIQPFTDGGLACAGLFVAEKMGLTTRETPRDFIETTAFTNWAKFSIKTDKTNQDYIASRPKLDSSFPFVLAELSVLQPGIVLVPKMVWSLDFYAAAMQGVSPSTTFIPIPQFNSTVVNIHLKEHVATAKRLREAPPVERLGLWMEHLVGFKVENAWRFIALLDSQV